MSETLPKTLPGVVCQQMVRCGKLGCKCQRGILHGPYFYRFWREGGRLRKQYVPRPQLQLVRQLCLRRQLEQRERRSDGQKASEFTDSIKEVEKLIHDFDGIESS
jgi:hypothetical protein